MFSHDAYIKLKKKIVNFVILNNKILTASPVFNDMRIEVEFCKKHTMVYHWFSTCADLHAFQGLPSIALFGR